METESFLEKDEVAEDEAARGFNSMFDELWPRLLPQQIDLEGLPARVSSNVITPTDVPIPDCAECGACCGAFVRVPLDPGSKMAESDTWQVKARVSNCDVVVDRFIKRRKGDLACSKLIGAVGEASRCGIYDDRPRTCRTFEAGSDRCHAIRRAYGIEPFLTLEQMSEAIGRLNERDEGSTGGAEMVESVRFTNGEGTDVRIEAAISDGSLRVLHEFDPGRETWYRSQFEGFSLVEVIRLLSGARKAN